jgi:hypothetical protein
VRFGCGHLPINDEIHEASWGARLIYHEVVEGFGGVVYDRQTPDGEPEKVRTLFPVVDRALEEFRKPENMYALDSSQSGHLAWRDGRVLVVMSPQGSYGYLYITAVLEREGHEGESEIWGRNGEWAEGELAKRVQLGNWPPEIVEAREKTERESKLRYARENLPWTLREYMWAEMKVRTADTPRKAKLRQKEVDEIAERISELYLTLGDYEFFQIVKREGREKLMEGFIF